MNGFADSKSLEEWRRKRELKARRQRQHQQSFPDELLLTESLREEVKDQDLDEQDEGGDDDGVVVPLTAAQRRKREREALLRQTSQKRGRQHPQQQEVEASSSTPSDVAATMTTTFVAPGDAAEEDPRSPTESMPPPGASSDANDDDAAPLAQSHLPPPTAQEREILQRSEDEIRLLKEASQIGANALQAAREVADGVLYTTPMPSTWNVPRHVLLQGPKVWDQIRSEWHVEVEGADVPPPASRFVDLKLPSPILHYLRNRNIKKPTPIQMQGLPAALSGRDLVGIAFTGSGKTLTFSLPLVLAAYEEELRMPLMAGEGPIGIALAPSRELARQTYELVNDLCESINQQPWPPESSEQQRPQFLKPHLTSQLIIGGEPVREQLRLLQERGLHCLVGTPGRVRDLLQRHALNLNICRYLCLDEADRMLDLGFDAEVGEIVNRFPHQRQTLLFSATFPKKFQDFARQTLVQPVVVNVGRAGAANLDVIQEVEYVQDEAKIVYLLHCLQKTAPPVIVFTERKGSADDIHEYLLLKGVDAVSIHGGKDQDERNEAIRLFKNGEKDVLIATDVAAKGLDFPDIQHVINFDMPTEIENYVHRIGRTGRCGKTGVATTFINKGCDETTLRDLKGLLTEARQRIPPVLQMLEDPPRDPLLMAAAPGGGARAAGGCSFCGGLGHSIVDCPKIDKDARRVAGSHRDVISGGGDW